MRLKVLSQPKSYFIKTSKPIDDWSNRDFLIYFSHLYTYHTSFNFRIPKEAWAGMLSRIKGFRLKMNLSNAEYKEFIDNVFNIFFTQDNYVPTFGAIVSEKVFYTTLKLLKNLNYSNDKFMQLKKELYSNDLFKKLLTI